MTALRLAAGQIVGGRYTVESPLKETDSITTYRAITAPNRRVAVKVLNPTIGRAREIRTSLDRRSAAMAKQADGAILRTVDRGRDEETGALFWVTELADTPSLAQLVELCPLSMAEGAAFLRSLASAVDAAHTDGLWHLALKPTNIFVGPPPSCAATIVDFEAAVVRALLHEGAPPERSTIPWIAPEQTRPGATVGAAADVFSAALVAFYALTGSSYWQSCRGPLADLEAWRTEIDAPRRAASAAAADVGVTLADAVDAPFGRALAADPADRFPSLTAFAEELSRALERSAEAPRPAPRPVLPPAPRAGTSAARALEIRTEPGAADAHAPRPESASAPIAPPNPAPAAPQPYLAAAMPTSVVESTGPASGWGPTPPPSFPGPPPSIGSAAARPAPLAARGANPAGKARPGALALIAVATFVLVGGVTVTVLALSGTRRAGDAISPAHALTAATSQSTAPSATAVGDPPPSASVAAAPAPPEPPRLATEEPPAPSVAPDRAELRFDCAPTCEAVLVAGTRVSRVDEPFDVPPGKYVVKALNRGVSHTKVVTLEAGQSETVSFRLFPLPPWSKPKKPCAKGQKGCK